jgi:integrase
VQLPKDSGRWFVSVNHQGERKVRKAADRKEAEKIAREINETLRAEKLGIVRKDFSLNVTRERVTLGDFSETWFKGHVEMNLKWNTRRYYADMLQRIPESLKRRPLESVSREDLRKMAGELLEGELSRATVAGLIRTLSAIFNAAAEDGIFLGANPALRPGRLLRVAEDPEEVDILTKEEGERLLVTAKDHFGEHYPVFFTALRTAARQGELIGLMWDDIDAHGGFLTIRRTVVNGEANTPKNGKSRRVPMSPQLVELLKGHKKKLAAAALAAGKRMSPWVFPSPTGHLMDPSKLRRELAAALKKAGLRAVTFHSLRHSALTTMAEAGVPMPVLQKIAGHSSIAVTARYYLHVKPEDHRGAVAFLDSASSKSANGTRMEAGKQAEKDLPKSVQLAEIAG